MLLTIVMLWKFGSYLVSQNEEYYPKVLRIKL